MHLPNDPYAAQAEFIRPAWAYAEPWRVLVMIIGFEAVFLFSPAIVSALLPTDAAVDAYHEQTTAFGTLATFFTFGVALIGFVFLLRRVHHRGFWSAVGPPGETIQNFKKTAYSVALVLLAMEVFPPWIIATELAEVRDLGRWLILLPIALLALLIQTGTEEIYFRGYLQQQFACISPSRWIWMGVPSVLFGLLHYFSGQGFADGLMWVIWATLLGLCCADLTARTGNIGAAVGLHLSNNAFALLLYGMENRPTSGLALFLFPYEDPAQFDYGPAALLSVGALFELAGLCITVLVLWLAARIAIRR